MSHDAEAATHKFQHAGVETRAHTCTCHQMKVATFTNLPWCVGVGTEHTAQQQHTMRKVKQLSVAGSRWISGEGTTPFSTEPRRRRDEKSRREREGEKSHAIKSQSLQRGKGAIVWQSELFCFTCCLSRGLCLWGGEDIKGKGEQGQVTFTQQVDTTEMLLKIEVNLHVSTREDQKFTSSAPFAINANVPLI